MFQEIHGSPEHVNVFMDKFHVEGKRFCSWASFTHSAASGGLLTVIHKTLSDKFDFCLWPEVVPWRIAFLECVSPTGPLAFVNMHLDRHGQLASSKGTGGD